MQIEVKIDPGCTETRVVVHAPSMTEEVSSLLRRLQPGAPKVLVGFQGDRAEVLRPETLYRVYAQGGRVLAAAREGTYTLRGPLYEWEKRLAPEGFVRLSQSELIALRHVKAFDLSLAGTICIQLTDGTVTYASRRYVARLKGILGL